MTTGTQRSAFAWPEEHCPSPSAPAVTIAIPVYNGENFLADAIDSVLNQTFTDLELIVVDNASTDRTSVICERFAAQDDRLRYFRNGHNLGAAANYNRGLELARGTYFKWLAHDDWLSDNYVEQCAAMLDRYPDVVLAHGMPREMIDRETPFLDSRFTVPLWGNAGPVERFAAAMRMPRTCHAIFGLMRRDAAERTTRHWPYYTSDRNLVAEIALLGRFASVPEAIFYNRKHAMQSMAQSADLRRLNAWQDTSNSRPYATMHLSRLRHFWTISGRYADIASRAQLVASGASYMASPKKLLHYTDELAWMAMPRVYGRLRDVMRRGFRAMRPAPDYIAPQTREVAEKAAGTTAAAHERDQSAREMRSEDTKQKSQHA